MKNYMLACASAIALYLALHYLMWSEPALLVTGLAAWRMLSAKHAIAAMVAAILAANAGLLVWAIY